MAGVINVVKLTQVSEFKYLNPRFYIALPIDSVHRQISSLQPTACEITEIGKEEKNKSSARVSRPAVCWGKICSASMITKQGKVWDL